MFSITHYRNTRFFAIIGSCKETFVFTEKGEMIDDVF